MHQLFVMLWERGIEQDMDKDVFFMYYTILIFEGADIYVII